MPDDDTSRNKVKLNARVAPTKKQEWRDALEDGQTLSSLIQRAVDREIRDEYVHVKAIDELGEKGGSDVDIDTSGIEDQLGELRSTVSAVNRKIDTLAAAGDEQNSVESFEDLAEKLLSRLPHYPEDFPRDAVESLPGIESPEETIEALMDSRHVKDIRIEGSAQRLSTEISEPEHRVRHALLFLERDTTEHVHSIMYDGVRHWVQF